MLDRVDTEIEPWLATERYEVASGWIEPGTMGAMRFRLAGVVDGEERVILEHFTRMGGSRRHRTGRVIRRRTADIG